MGIKLGVIRLQELHQIYARDTIWYSRFIVTETLKCVQDYPNLRSIFMECYCLHLGTLNGTHNELCKNLLSNQDNR